jgi:hypothetical protein
MRAGISSIVLVVTAVGSMAANEVSQKDIDRLAASAGMKGDEFVAFCRECEDARVPAITALRGMVQKARDAGRTRPAREFEERRKSIVERTHAAFPNLSPHLEVGEFGALPFGQTVVRQILGPRSLRAQLAGPIQAFVIIEGVSTAGLTDTPDPAGRVPGLPTFECFTVAGTRTVETVDGGTQTLKVLKRVDDAPFAEYLRMAYGKKRETPQRAAPAAPPQSGLEEEVFRGRVSPSK